MQRVCKGNSLLSMISLLLSSVGRNIGTLVPLLDAGIRESLFVYIITYGFCKGCSILIVKNCTRVLLFQLWPIFERLILTYIIIRYLSLNFIGRYPVDPHPYQLVIFNIDIRNQCWKTQFRRILQVGNYEALFLRFTIILLNKA